VSWVKITIYSRVEFVSTLAICRTLSSEQAGRERVFRFALFLFSRVACGSSALGPHSFSFLFNARLLHADGGAPFRFPPPPPTQPPPFFPRAVCTRRWTFDGTRAFLDLWSVSLPLSLAAPSPSIFSAKRAEPTRAEERVVRRSTRL